MLWSSRKKQAETHYIEEARRASSIFPAGDLIPHERPDFLLHAATGTIGIEVTELCREEPRAEAGRLMKVPNTARGRYIQLANAEPVDVSTAFSSQATTIGFNELAHSLAEFVYKHRHEKTRRFTWRDLPKGYLHIGIHRPNYPGGKWHAVRAFDVVSAPKQLVEARIAEKNTRVAEYRKVASELWLLIVNDRFLGPGEVHVGSELMTWKFVFDFDRVLLFCREPGGTGTVHELHRCS